MKLIIYGNGRIARIVYQYVKNNFEVCCFSVQRDLVSSGTFEGLPMIPIEDLQAAYPPSEHGIIVAVGYLKMNLVRAQKFRQLVSLGYQPINYIHPSVHIHSGTKLGHGNVILEHVAIQPGASIGDNCFIWSNAVIAHGCVIGDDCWITSSATIAGDSILGSRCFLGVNSTLAHNLTVGESTFVGANCLITKDAEPGSAFVSRSSELHRLDSDRFLDFSGV